MNVWLTAGLSGVLSYYATGLITKKQGWKTTAAVLGVGYSLYRDARTGLSTLAQEFGDTVEGQIQADEEYLAAQTGGSVQGGIVRNAAGVVVGRSMLPGEMQAKNELRTRISRENPDMPYSAQRALLERLHAQWVVQNGGTPMGSGSSTPTSSAPPLPPIIQAGGQTGNLPIPVGSSLGYTPDVAEVDQGGRVTRRRRLPGELQASREIGNATYDSSITSGAERIRLFQVSMDAWIVANGGTPVGAIAAGTLPALNGWYC